MAENIWPKPQFYRCALFQRELSIKKTSSCYNNKNRLLLY